MITYVAVDANDDNPALPPFLFGLFALLRGVGNIATGPVSEALLGSNNLRGGECGVWPCQGSCWAARFGYGDSYGALILYTGACMVAGTLAAFCFRSSKKMA
jgi:hypothetical protein